MNTKNVRTQKNVGQQSSRSDKQSIATAASKLSEISGRL